MGRGEAGMHRVERLERLLGEAVQRGYIVRQEWLGGRGGGTCEIAGRKHLFVDLALSTGEQLAQIAEALAMDDRLAAQRASLPVDRPQAA
jgi:hypothetical protein